MAFKKFCRTPFKDESETGLHFLATLDAVVTEAVNSFKFVIEEHKDGDRYISENELEIGQDVRR